jgi:hypothetical protein
MECWRVMLSALYSLSMKTIGTSIPSGADSQQHSQGKCLLHCLSRIGSICFLHQVNNVAASILTHPG